MVFLCNSTGYASSLRPRLAIPSLYSPRQHTNMLVQMLIQRLGDQPKRVLAAEAILLVLVAWRLLARWSLTLAPNAPPLYNEGRLLGSLRFTTSRADYLAEGTRKSRDGQFSFWYGGHHVVVVSGEAGRTSFQTARNLDPGAGWAGPPPPARASRRGRPKLTAQG